MLTGTVAAVPPAITPLTTGSSVPSSTPFPLPYAFFPLAGTRLISACLLARTLYKTSYRLAMAVPARHTCLPIVASLSLRGNIGINSPVCLHADNTLDADSSVGLTSGYGGDTYDAAWVQDPDVGVVIECNKVCIPLKRRTSFAVPCAALCD